MTKSVRDPLVEELTAIKKLMMLQLLATGYKQKHLAATLGVSEATLSGMLPKGISKEFARGTGNEE